MGHVYYRQLKLIRRNSIILLSILRQIGLKVDTDSITWKLTCLSNNFSSRKLCLRDKNRRNIWIIYWNMIDEFNLEDDSTSQFKGGSLRIHPGGSRSDLLPKSKENQSLDKETAKINYNCNWGQTFMSPFASIPNKCNICIRLVYFLYYPSSRFL